MGPLVLVGPGDNPQVRKYDVNFPLTKRWRPLYDMGMDRAFDPEYLTQLGEMEGEKPILLGSRFTKR